MNKTVGMDVLRYIYVIETNKMDTPNLLLLDFYNY